MRLGNLGRAAAISLACGIIGLAALPTPSALAASGGAEGIPVALKSYDQMLVDQTHHVIIFADYGNGILVTDMSGTTIASIPEVGTRGIALSPDNGSLYVAMSTSDSIAAIDTSTWKQTALYGTGQGNDPWSMAFTGGRIWFHYTNQSGSNNGLGSLDPTAADPTPTLLPDTVNGPLATSPADPGVLVTTVATGDPASATPNTLEVLDVSTGTPKVTAQTPVSNIWSLAISPDGKELATNYAGVLQISDLSRSSNYPAFPRYQGLDNITFNPDGTLAFTVIPNQGQNVQVETVGPTSSDTLRTYSYPTSGTQPYWIAGLAWDSVAGHLLALDSSGPYSLLTLTDPEKADTQLPDPGSIPAQALTGQPFTLPVTPRNGIPYTAGTVMHVTRIDPAHPQGVTFPDVPLDAAGSFLIHDTVAVAGTTWYRVSIDADTTHTPTTATFGVNIDTPTALTVTTSTTTTGYRGWAKVTAHLGPTYTNRSVTLWVHPAGQHPWQIATGNVDANGNLSLWYQVTSNLSFSASYNGDSRSTPATATTPTVWDQASVTAALHGYYAQLRHGSTVYDIFHRRSKVQLNVTIAPNKAGHTARIVIEQYYWGAWHTIKDIKNLTLNSASTTSYSTNLTGGNNTSYRAIAEYTGAPTDTTNVNTWGTWQYLTLDN